MFHRFVHPVQTYKFNIGERDEYYHEIITDRALKPKELIKLGQILSSFPHASNHLEEWPTKFLNLDVDSIPENLLKLAANALDNFGNTVLGVAAEYGKEIKAIEKLIAIGAEIDKVDKNNKTALHWAICNKISFYDKESFKAVAAVKCLLDHGASVKITCYQNKTPLKYAIDRGYSAAASLIRDHMESDKINRKLTRELNRLK